MATKNYPKKRIALGFTFVEIMLTIAILSSGLLFINQAYLRLVSGSSYFFRRSYAQIFLYNKIWELEHELKQSEGPELLQKSGRFTAANREFNWKAVLTPFDEHQEIYMVTLEIDWDEAGSRRASLEYSTYIHK